MRILVLQHVAVEHPGIFRDFWREDGHTWDTVELDHGEKIPKLEPYDVMVVMGGPQDVWQEAEHAWLASEKAAIRSFVAGMKRPFMGICLGHQLLAEAIGGHVGPAKAPEVGVMSVGKTERGRASPLFQGLPDPFQVLQWHGAAVSELPPEATVLASSKDCPIQAFRYGKHAYGLQFHVEATAATVGDWAAIPAYRTALEAAMGAGAVDRLTADVSARLPEFNAMARRIYQNFLGVIRS